MARPSKYNNRPGFVRKADRYCETCDRDFVRPAELKRHLKETLIHNPNARQYPCKYCGDLFTQKSNLKIHERIHTDDHREVCKIPLNKDKTAVCDFTCIDPSAMIRHIKRVHFGPFVKAGESIPAWLQAASARRSASKRRVAIKNCHAQAQQTSDSSGCSTPEPTLVAPSPRRPFTAQTLMRDNVEPLLPPKSTNTEAQSIVQTPELGLDLFNFNNHGTAIAPFSQPFAAHTFTADYNQFPQFPASLGFSNNFPDPTFQVPTNTDNCRPPSFEELVSFSQHPPQELSMFTDVASNSFPQLLDDQFTFGNQFANSQPVAAQSNLNWCTPNPASLFDMGGQQVQMNLYDYSQLANFDDFNLFRSSF